MSPPALYILSEVCVYYSLQAGLNSVRQRDEESMNSDVQVVQRILKRIVEYIQNGLI